MTASLPSGDSRRAERLPELVAVHPLPGQTCPLRVTALRPLAVVACEALPEADRLLAAQGCGLAAKLPANVLHGVTS